MEVYKYTKEEADDEPVGDVHIIPTLENEIWHYKNNNTEPSEILWFWKQPEADLFITYATLKWMATSDLQAKCCSSISFFSSKIGSSNPRYASK